MPGNGMTADSSDVAAVEVVDLSHDGRGVAVVGGSRVFVAGALPGERVVLRSHKRRRRYAEAELVAIAEPSAARVDPPCAYFGVCGGCALQHLDYQAQVEFKQDVLAEALGRIGKVTPKRWLAPLTGSQWHYRRRARLGVKYVAAKDRVLVGFRERSARFIADMAECRVLVRPMDRLPTELAAVLADSALRDRVPQVEIAIGDSAGAMILRTLDPPGQRDLDAFAALGERLDVDVYLQSGGPDTVRALGAEPRQLAYELPSEHVRIEFEPGDFIQVNAEMNRVMVAAALEAAEIDASDRVLDLYCGIGNFSLPLARRAREVLGVEGAGPLVARAAHNAARNDVHNARFATANLDESDWPFFREAWDVILLDPARNGAAAAVAAMGRMRPRRVVYVSCDPGTLARDAGALVTSGRYRLTSARIVDMFANTHHVEAIAVFDRHD
jgi:23S rRNA (uracil1939-C5)-methyltransferase